MVPSMRDEVHVQLHDVTGKVQRARLIIAAQRREVRVAALDAQLNFKMNQFENKKQASLSGEQDSRAGVKPPAWGTGLPLVRGMG